MRKNRYAVIDDCTTKKANSFIDYFETMDAAIAAGRAAFDRLTDYDKKQRDAFFVAVIDDDENIVDVIENYI